MNTKFLILASLLIVCFLISESSAQYYYDYPAYGGYYGGYVGYYPSYGYGYGYGWYGKRSAGFGSTETD